MEAVIIDITSADALDVDALVRSLILDPSSQLADDASLQEIPTGPGARDLARERLAVVVKALNSCSQCRR